MKEGMFVDIFDVKLGDKRQVLVTQEVLEKEINPKLEKGWTLSGRIGEGETVALSQGRAVSMQTLEDRAQKYNVEESVLRSPITAG